MRGDLLEKRDRTSSDWWQEASTCSRTTSKSWFQLRNVNTDLSRKDANWDLENFKRGRSMTSSENHEFVIERTRLERGDAICIIVARGCPVM